MKKSSAHSVFRQYSGAALLFGLLNMVLLFRVHNRESKDRVNWNPGRNVHQLREILCTNNSSNSSIRTTLPILSAGVPTTETAEVAEIQGIRVSRQRWELVSYSLYVYSAHVHPLKGKVVFIALAPSPKRAIDKRRASCVLADANGTVIMRTSTSSEWAPDKPGRFQTQLLICEYGVGASIPKYATLTIGSEKLQFYLPVNYNPPTELKDELAACIKPFNYFYPHPDHLQEFIEVSNMFGVKSFTFYNRSAAENTSQLLRAYAKQSTDRLGVQVFDWPLPLRPDGPALEYYKKMNRTNPYTGFIEVHDFGQLASMLDCYLRYSHVFKYVLFIDVDELMIPYKHKTYSELIRAKNGTGATVFYFLNTYFRLKFPNDKQMVNNIRVQRLNLLTLLKTRRDKQVFGIGNRSKYIAEILKIKFPDVHLTRGGKALAIDPEEGLLHHYRAHLDPIEETMRDARTLRYQEEIIQRILKAKKSGLVWDN